MNSEEFNTFYRRYYKVSVKIANGIVQSRFTAEDVMRDIRLFKGKTKQYIYISRETGCFQRRKASRIGGMENNQ